MKIEMTDTFFKDLKNIFRPRLYRKFKEYKFERKMKKQRYKQGYSDSDCWSLHYWLTETFPKMIYNLRDMKHGAPEYEFEEFEELPLDWVNEYALKFTEQVEKEAQKGEDYDYSSSICFWGGTIEDRCFCRWWIILTRIAWCLEQASEDLDVYNEYEEEYNKQMWNETFNSNDLFEVASYDENGKPKTYKFKENQVNKDLKEKYYKKEEEIWKQKEAYKDEALSLISKYFYNLWD